MSVEVYREEGADTEIQAIAVEEGLVVLRIVIAILKVAVAVAVEALTESEISERIEEVNLEVEVEVGREVAKQVLAAEERLLAEAVIEVQVEV